jgi:hypothetical protein
MMLQKKYFDKVILKENVNLRKEPPSNKWLLAFHAYFYHKMGWKKE